MAVCLTRSHSVDSVVMFPWRLNSLKKVKGNKFKMLLFCEIYEPVFLKIKIKLIVHCAGVTLVVPESVLITLYLNTALRMLKHCVCTKVFR